MSRNHEKLEPIRQIVRDEINRLGEKIIFAIIFTAGVIMIVVAKFLSDAYWQSLFLDLGSSLASFVFLFWIFQYFLGRQPRDAEQTFAGILDAEPISPSKRKVRNRSISKDSDEASIILHNRDI